MCDIDSNDQQQKKKKKKRRFYSKNDTAPYHKTYQS